MQTFERTTDLTWHKSKSLCKRDQCNKVCIPQTRAYISVSGTQTGSQAFRYETYPTRKENSEHTKFL